MVLNLSLIFGSFDPDLNSILHSSLIFAMSLLVKPFRSTDGGRLTIDSLSAFISLLLSFGTSSAFSTGSDAYTVVALFTIFGYNKRFKSPLKIAL